MRGFTGTIWIAMAAVVVALAGCGGDAAAKKDSAGQKGQATEQATVETSTPSAAVETFLHAVRGGDDQLASEMLTQVARQKTREMDLEVAPPGSDTAEFTIGKVEKIGESGARVYCDWSDIDGEGGRTREQIIWVLRQEANGWRIAGMAPTIFPGEPPLLLNFEDPEEMVEKLNWVRQEVVRRAQAEAMREARRNEPNPNAEPTVQR